MKLFASTILALATLVSVNSHASGMISRSECKTIIDVATQDVALVKERFTVGEVTLVDVGQVQLAELNARLDCHEILADDYCAQATVVVDSIAKGVAQEMAVGSRTVKDASEAKLQAARIKAMCK